VGVRKGHWSSVVLGTLAMANSNHYRHREDFKNKKSINPFLEGLKIQDAQDLNQQFTPPKHQYLQFVSISSFTLHMYTTASALKRFTKGQKTFCV